MKQKNVTLAENKQGEVKQGQSYTDGNIVRKRITGVKLKIMDL